MSEQHHQKAEANLLWVSFFFLFIFFLFDSVSFTHFILETPTGVLAKSADPDQMPHDVASDPGLHYFVKFLAIFQQKNLN